MTINIVNSPNKKTIIIMHAIGYFKHFFLHHLLLSQWIPNEYYSSSESQNITSYPFTLSPRASTIPEHSNPGTRGVLGGLSIFPCRTIKSMKFNPLWKANVKGEKFNMRSKRKHRPGFLFFLFFSSFPPSLLHSFLSLFFFFLAKCH